MFKKGKYMLKKDVLNKISWCARQGGFWKTAAVAETVIDIKAENAYRKIFYALISDRNGRSLVMPYIFDLLREFYIRFVLNKNIV